MVSFTVQLVFTLAGLDDEILLFFVSKATATKTVKFGDQPQR